MQTLLCLMELPERLTQWGLGRQRKGKRQNGSRQTTSVLCRQCAAGSRRGAISDTAPVPGHSSCRPAGAGLQPPNPRGCRWPHGPAAPLPAPAEGRSSSRQKPCFPRPSLVTGRDVQGRAPRSTPRPRPLAAPRGPGSESDAVFCRAAAAAALLDSSGARRGAHVPETAQM